MSNRIVITGAGVVSALGCGKSENLAALKARRSGISRVHFLSTSLNHLLVGEVPLSNTQISDFLGVSTTYPRSSLLGILALKEALIQSRLLTIEDEERLPLVSGTTVGGMDLTEQSFPSVSRFHDCGASTDVIASQFKAISSSTTVSTACSSAMNAILYGANLIRTGQARRVAVGGTEALSNFHLNGFNSLMILDTKPCCPFDANRAGLNLGEGAAYIILEDEITAINRHVPILGVLSGGGNACDAFHQTASSENGEGAYLAMKKALASSGIKPREIDYINAHGTGTVNNDASESMAIRRVFDSSIPPVSSTKAYTGHTTSASGSIETVFCLLALQEGILLPQLNFSTPDPACIIPSSGGEKKLKHILCNSFGFGGNDSSIIISRYEGAK